MTMLTNPRVATANCFALVGRDRVVRCDGAQLSFSDLHVLDGLGHTADFFSEPEVGLSALELHGMDALPAPYRLETIRSFFAANDGEPAYLLARARALLSWRCGLRFCSRCGHELEDSSETTSRTCPHCGKVFFPRIEPCVIVLVTRGDKVLLARHVQRNQDVYACIAGFMEVGETAEHAVCREVFEETGIRIKDIRYKGSQSWPFPDQLMLAFTAEYESGEIRLQEDELSDAGWFDRDACPTTPLPGSVAYRLIHNLF